MHKEQRRVTSRRYIETHRAEHNAEAKRHYRRFAPRVKLEVLVHYGGDPPKCACCGEDLYLFLGIDHIAGGGRKHVKRVGTGLMFYRWLQINGYPDGFQVLCMNCNWGKYRNRGICPHKLVRLSEKA